ncbi:MAG: dihydroorotate dehydrogenase electron transfer subunit [Clostridia bacterium]|nr:dihydroorotate dehydrogenase electron transfer subunit [Clostridia bacterium]
MPIQRICEVVSAEKLNQFAYSLLLDAGEMADEAAFGQFVHIKCGHSRLLRRPISICDWQEGLLRVVFEVRGEGTEWLSRREAGDKLDVLGPLGHGFQDVRGKRLLLAGGGIGVPPMLACAKGAADHSAAVLGFRDAAHAMLTKDFKEHCAQVAVTTDDGSLGRRGFVAQAVEEILARDNGFDAVLACGPKIMLRTVADAAKKYGVPCQVSMEERMGCGVGACLVCACKAGDGSMKHVCKDGPVFNAEEVSWDD